MLERHHGLQGFSIWGNPGVAGVGLSPDACQVRVLPTLGIKRRHWSPFSGCRPSLPKIDAPVSVHALHYRLWRMQLSGAAPGRLGKESTSLPSLSTAGSCLPRCLIRSRAWIFSRRDSVLRPTCFCPPPPFFPFRRVCAMHASVIRLAS